MTVNSGVCVEGGGCRCTEALEDTSELELPEQVHVRPWWEVILQPQVSLCCENLQQADRQ